MAMHVSRDLGVAYIDDLNFSFLSHLTSAVGPSGISLLMLIGSFSRKRKESISDSSFMIKSQLSLLTLCQIDLAFQVPKLW